MGLVNFVTGKKDPDPVQPRGKGKTPLFQHYGYKHAQNTRIKDSIGFNKKISDVRWNKLMEKTGKYSFKTRGGEAIGRGEAKKIVAGMIKKADYKGLSGQQIKDKLVRYHGLKYKDAGEIARAATYHYYEPPATGPTWKEIQEQEKMEKRREKRNILESVISREREEGSAGIFRNRRGAGAKNVIKSDFESEDSARLGVEQRKYRVGALAGKEVSEGDFRGGAFQGRKMPSASAASPGAGTAGVAGGYGTKMPDKLGNIGRIQGGVAPLGFRKGVK